jgi:hypothetical protein
MPVHLHLGRSLTAVLVLLCLASVGVLNAGPSGAQSLNRQPPAKLVVASQATLHARAAERRRSHLRLLARHACAAHKHTLCLQSRARLARIDAQRGGVTNRRRVPVHQQITQPASSSGFSSSASSGATAGSSSTATSRISNTTPASPNTTPPGTTPPSTTPPSPSSSAGGSGSGSSGSSESGSLTGTPSPSESGSLTGTPSPSENGSLTGTSGSSGSSETFGLPFVKGITADFAGWGPNNAPEIASEMHSLGVNWEREALDWSEAEPERGVFDWSSFDQVVAEARANGITILPLLGYAPSWTTPGDAAAYAEFVAAAVARYGPGTSANLQWWELWNEPYFAYAWSGKTPEPEAYARDYLAAAEAAKSVAPTVKLLIAADYQEAAQTGGSSPEEKTWIDDMFTAVPTLGEWIDGVSVHPYGGDPSTPLAETGGYLDTSGVWAFQRIDTIREKFLAHGVNVPFWITEDGWSTWEASEATVAHDYADLITQIKLRPWIRALFPFGLREGTEHPTNDQPGFGLLKFGTWQPKAAWSVLQEGFETLS